MAAITAFSQSSDNYQWVSRELVLSVISVVMLIFVPVAAAADFNDEITKAIDLCTDYDHPNLQAYTSAEDRLKELHDHYFEYRALAAELATSDGIRAIIQYAQHDSATWIPGTVCSIWQV